MTIERVLHHLTVRKRSRVGCGLNPYADSAVCLSYHQLIVGAVAHSAHFHASLLEHLKNIISRACTCTSSSLATMRPPTCTTRRLCSGLALLTQKNPQILAVLTNSATSEGDRAKSCAPSTQRQLSRNFVKPALSISRSMMERATRGSSPVHMPNTTSRCWHMTSASVTPS